MSNSSKQRGTKRKTHIDSSQSPHKKSKPSITIDLTEEIPNLSSPFTSKTNTVKRILKKRKRTDQVNMNTFSPIPPKRRKPNEPIAKKKLSIKPFAGNLLLMDEPSY